MNQAERAFETPRSTKAGKVKADCTVTELREKLIAKNQVISEQGDCTGNHELKTTFSI